MKRRVERLAIAQERPNHRIRRALITCRLRSDGMHQECVHDRAGPHGNVKTLPAGTMRGTGLLGELSKCLVINAPQLPVSHGRRAIVSALEACLGCARRSSLRRIARGDHCRGARVEGAGDRRALLCGERANVLDRRVEQATFKQSPQETSFEAGTSSAARSRRRDCASRSRAQPAASGVADARGLADIAESVLRDGRDCESKMPRPEIVVRIAHLPRSGERSRNDRPSEAIQGPRSHGPGLLRKEAPGPIEEFARLQVRSL